MAIGKPLFPDAMVGVGFFFTTPFANTVTSFQLMTKIDDSPFHLNSLTPNKRLSPEKELVRLLQCLKKELYYPKE